MRVFNGLGDLEDAVGTHLGYSRWHTVTQEQIDTFADATGDDQWIHVDPGRAGEGPFGSTIAHGFLTLSLATRLTWQVYSVEGIRMGINYGADKVRFPSPVLVGARVRAGIELTSVTPANLGSRVSTRVVIECEDSEKPACVVQILSLLVPAP